MVSFVSTGLSPVRGKRKKVQNRQNPLLRTGLVGVIGLSSLSVGTSVGASVVSNVGSSSTGQLVSQRGVQGLSNVSGFFPMMGTSVGSGLALRVLLEKKKRRVF